METAWTPSALIRGEGGGSISSLGDIERADDVAAIAEREVRRALPEAEGAKVVHARVIKEKRATFSARPGIERLRAPTRGPVANLYLAGDWCRTGWPATMEGAVRSGYLAANAVLKDQRRSTESLTGLGEAPLYTWLTS